MQLLCLAEKVLFAKNKCVEELLKSGNYALSSDPYQIKDVGLKLIYKIKLSAKESYREVEGSC